VYQRDGYRVHPDQESSRAINVTIIQRRGPTETESKDSCIGTSGTPSVKELRLMTKELRNDPLEFKTGAGVNASEWV
jgi:hypothetical protein